MKHFLFKQFHGVISYLAAFAVVLLLSTLVGGYAYIEAKQIKIEADLLIAGEVRTNNLCIGPPGVQVCRSAWPQELRNTDVVAVGAVQPNTWSTACNQPSDGGRRCDAFWLFWYSPWFERNKYDPRSVLTASFSQAAMPCYETPNGSFRSCGPARTYPVFNSFSCSSGFTANEVHPVASAWATACWASAQPNNCRAATCTLP